MANVIQLKRKTTAGAPTIGQLAIGELCLVIPDETFYWKKDGSTLVGPVGTSSAATWGSIIGSLSNQTDIQNALNAKADTSALSSKADIDGPDFTGVPTAPTASGGTNTTQVATTAFVQAAISALVSGAPGVLDTLDELAQALGNDANFATTVTNSLATKLDANSTIDGGTIA